MFILIIGLILFLGIHCVRIVAPAFRDAQIAKGGMQRWKMIYTVVSILGFAVMVWGYSIARPEAALVYEPPVWMKHINALLMLLSLISLGISQVPTGKLKPILKHPMLLAVKLWAFGHLLSNGDVASLLLFGSFLVWAIVDRISLKRRGDGGPVIAGPLSNDILGIAIGLVLYGLLIGRGHAWLFGVSPM